MAMSRIKSPKPSQSHITVQQRKNKLGQLAVWILLATLLVFVAIKLFQSSLGQVRSGKPPDFTLTTFSGQTYTLSEFKGQIVIINFWASWCDPCQAEAADLEMLWRNYKDKGVLLLGVGYADTDKEALTYLSTWNITYPNGPDVGTRISQSYRIRGVPETYIVTQDGILSKSYIGPISYENIETVLETLLDQ